MKKLTEEQRKEVAMLGLNCMEEYNADFDFFMDEYSYSFDPYEYKEEMEEIFMKCYDYWFNDIDDVLFD